MNTKRNKQIYQEKIKMYKTLKVFYAYQKIQNELFYIK